jgi:succinoglycan biosynthesis transport protein ExoP
MILPVLADDERITPAMDCRPRVSAYPEPPGELAVPEIMRMLRRRVRLVVACALAGLLLAGGYVVLRSPRYEAMARVEVSPAGTNSLGLDSTASRLPPTSDPTIQLQSAVTVLEGPTVGLAVIGQLKMAERKDFAGSSVQPAGTMVDNLSPEVRDRLLRRFHKGLKVEVIPKTDIIAVQFRATDPKLAADVVNVVVSSYAERNFRNSYDSATQVATWLSAQMADLKVKANQAQEQLAELQKKRGLIGTDETDNIVTEKLIERLNVCLMVGVGAAFDIHAGLARDAPVWMKNCGL